MDGRLNKAFTSWIFILLTLTMDDTDMSTAFMESDNFPNPMTQPQLCNRSRSSFICDPDGILTNGEANQLEFLAFDLRRSTVCVCETCDSRNLGASFGVYMVHNFTNINISMSLPEMAKLLRLKWKLGMCEDDIVVVIAAESQEAAFDMGSAIENIITREVGEKIFTECAVHFENSNFYQGLESMVNSYHDILRRLQRLRKKPDRGNLSLILGISLGIIALLLFLGAIYFAMKYLAYKFDKRDRREFFSKMQQESVLMDQKFEYHLCAPDGHQKTKNIFSVSYDDGDDGGDSGSDEGDYNNKKFDPMKLAVPPTTRTQRQLSDVAEENEEESEGSAKHVQVQHSKVVSTVL